MEQLAARKVHTLEVVGSSPSSATKAYNMSDFEIWIYRALATLAALFIGWYAKKLIAKIDELICTIQELAKNDVKQANQIDNIHDRLRVNDNRLNDHSQRIRKLETNRKGTDNNG